MKKYRVFNNKFGGISDRFESGCVIIFQEKQDFDAYEFNDVYGRKIVQAIWSPSGLVDLHYILWHEEYYTKKYFRPDRIYKKDRYWR